ncbi:MAG: 1-acyl-sn-glycerol-3-phosphate acyltransferase [Solirubrobacterales bacterium]|nr:1-acyl-sn-glycerol-3-phosphate acyltransferase [Solirubrobacterales bacterium]
MPDIRPQVYRDERPAEAMAPFHAHARSHEPGWTYTAARIFATPVALGLYRMRVDGLEHVPADGPVILAPNHFSNMDHFFVGARLQREIRFMSKSSFFGNNPVLSYVFQNAGHFPVRRGHQDEEAFATARMLLAAGGCVGMYAEGGRSRSGGLGEPRSGIGRLALQSGAPVVPAAIHGSLDVRGWRRGRFPQIRVSYGAPLTLDRVEEPSREQAREAAQTIFDRVRARYAGLGDA